jgi:hypothetical protein
MTTTTTKAQINSYDKMPEYIESVFNVFQSVNKKGEHLRDQRLKMIGLVIFNYVRKLAKDHGIDLKQFKEPESINLIPVFEYISFNNIELFDFSKIQMSDIDTTKNEDLERYVLSHIYYITQTTA